MLGKLLFSLVFIYFQVTLLVGTVLLDTLLNFGDPLLITSSHQRRGTTLFMLQGNHIKVTITFLASVPWQKSVSGTR